VNTPRLVASAVALAVILVIAVILRPAFKRLKATPEQRQRARAVARYGLALTLLLVLVTIWADQIRSAALVLSAFAVAMVLASKELLMCILGWWVKMAGDAYHIGDRVQIGDIKGDVMDYGLLTTTLLRVGTGRGDEFRSGGVVTVPNSMLLTTPVQSLTHTIDYKWHELDFMVGPDAPWETMERHLLEAATEAVAPYREEITKQLAAMEERFAFRSIGADPRAFLSITEEGALQLSLRVAIPVRGARAVEDQIVRRYLSLANGSNPGEKIDAPPG